MDHYPDYSQDALFDFGAGLGPNHDPRSQSYPPFNQSLQNSHNAWSPLSLEAMEQEAMAQQQQQRHQQMHNHVHLQQDYKPHMGGLPHQQLQDIPPPQQQPQHQPQQQPLSRPSSNHSDGSINLQTAGLDLDYSSMFPTNWQYQIQQAVQQQQQQFGMQTGSEMGMHAYNTSFGAQLQSSPVDLMPAANTDNYSVSAAMDQTNFMTMAGPMDSMNVMFNPLNDYQTEMTAYPINMNNMTLHRHSVSVQSSMPSGSPTGSIAEVQSLSDNEGWSIVNFNPQRASFASLDTVSNPSQNLHIRTNSDSSSDGPHSAELSGSYEEISWPLTSPHGLHGQDYLDAHYLQHGGTFAGQSHRHAYSHDHQHDHQHDHHARQHDDRHPSPASSAVSPSSVVVSYKSSSSSNPSPSSSGPLSPPLRRRKSPLEIKTTKAVIKKTPTGSRKDATAEKKVGRRRGPLRPEQRQQAHEIRKLRACLRCKFLKKTCDKGEPCGGCRPSHARLWQVPCTRMDIKDIGYFMKDWKADYERHVSLGFSVGNIKGFSTQERTLYVTHGYGHYLPITAREVFVRDDKCFGMDWIETTRSENPEEFEISTAKLSAGMEGVSTTLLSEYLDRHLDSGFELFVDQYFEGTKFLTEILKTAYRYYQKEKTPSVRKALKLVLAYNLTFHVTMVEGLSDEEQFQGRIIDDHSKFSGKTMAPVMINFQVKCALADTWRELQKDILEDLSMLYSSVYSGEKLKNWPTIFMLAAILLAIWEEMQFDCRYRIPDEQAADKFCDDMETTPVGVIVGLFQAISTKLPPLHEWDTKKYHHLLGSNRAVCDALTEVKGHINKHGKL